MADAQSEHLASIDWQRGKRGDAKGKYSREHTASRLEELLPHGWQSGDGPETVTM
jgi:hypothetical protein